ncbi:Uncharacterised protein [Klebsiella pneumoniae]|nr:Uncharacterised protein [Klebsiella pneumoniae]
MASDKVGAGGKIEHHRTGFFQLLRQLRRAYLLRLRAGRHLGGWHPAFAQLALLHQLAAWRAQAAGIVTRRVLFGAADIKQEGGAVALLQPALQRGLIDDRHPGPFGKMRHLSGPGAGGAGGGIVLPLLLVRQRLAGQRPADSAIAQGMDRVWHAGVDQRLGADDAAGASGAVDDNRRLRGGRQALHPQGQLAAGHADAAGDAHGLVLIEAPGVDDHHLLPAVDERLNLLGAERRCVTHAFHQLAKGFTGGVDVLKQLAAAAAPAGETLGQQGHILIAPGPQPFDGDLRQTLAVVVDGERGGEARYPPADLELQFAERQIDGKQRMSGGEIGLFTDVDQRQFTTVEQRLADPGGLAISVGGHSGYP